jgi:hypothetical protein
MRFILNRPLGTSAHEPGFSLSDWMKNWGTLKTTTDSTYDWLEIGEQAKSTGERL